MAAPPLPPPPPPPPPFLAGALAGLPPMPSALPCPARLAAPGEAPALAPLSSRVSGAHRKECWKGGGGAPPLPVAGALLTPLEPARSAAPPAVAPIPPLPSKGDAAVAAAVVVVVVVVVEGGLYSSNASFTPEGGEGEREPEVLAFCGSGAAAAAAAAPEVTTRALSLLPSPEAATHPSTASP